MVHSQRIALVQMLVGISCQNCCGICIGHRIVAVIEDGSFKVQGVCGRETYTLSKMGLPESNEFAVGKNHETLDIKERVLWGKGICLDL